MRIERRISIITLWTPQRRRFDCPSRERGGSEAKMLLLYEDRVAMLI